MWCLVMEYCTRGTLDTLLHHSSALTPLARNRSGSGGGGSGRPLALIDLPRLLPLMRGIARGMVHLHSRRPAILHRDLKPGNVFVAHGGVMKIGDFGMSRQVLPPSPEEAAAAAAAASAAASPTSTARRSTSAGSSGGGAGPCGGRHDFGRTLTPGVVGTIIYSAPEILDEQLQLPGAPVERILKADVYSFGVTIWEMTERRRPFDGLDWMVIQAQWIMNPASMALPPLTPREGASEADRRALGALQQLVTDCTALDPDRRPDFKAVLERIRRIVNIYDPRNSPAHGAAAAAAASAAGGWVGGADHGQHNHHHQQQQQQQQQQHEKRASFGVRSRGPSSSGDSGGGGGGGMSGAGVGGGVAPAADALAVVVQQAPRLMHHAKKTLILQREGSSGGLGIVVLAGGSSASGEQSQEETIPDVRM